MNKRRNPALFLILLLVLAVRCAFLLAFHHRVYSGPSTQYEQAFVAINLLERNGIKTFKEPPATTEADNPNRFLDPEDYRIRSPALVPYIKEVPGYAYFLAGIWRLAPRKLWIFAQIVQLVLELLAACGVYALARRFFGKRAGLLSVAIFGLLFYEARVSVIPYKDIFLLYAMVIIAWLASSIFFMKSRPGLRFAGICATTGLFYYFMPSILLFPVFLTGTLALLKRVNLRQASIFILMAVLIVGAIIWPYQDYVRAHRHDPGVTPPLFWYRFWLGVQVRTFYSTEEERFQDDFREKMRTTGLSIEEICRSEFLSYVKAHPLAYAARTLKKLVYGTLLVYANAGDASYSTSWSRFKTQNPEASLKAYARANPLRVLGMALGTLSASFLFPLGIVALILLGRKKRVAEGLFLFQIPLYFLLLHMFFHYEARYLTGTLAGYLPLAGYVFSKFWPARKNSPKPRAT
jgi:hypothetical protein